MHISEGLYILFWHCALCDGGGEMQWNDCGRRTAATRLYVTGYGDCRQCLSDNDLMQSGRGDGDGTLTS